MISTSKKLRIIIRKKESFKSLDLFSNEEKKEYKTEKY